MDEKSRYTGKEIDNDTKKLVSLVLKIAETAKREDKDYFIGSGFAIDLTVGKITRNHHDIDFHPMLEDSKWWINWFEEQGYQVEDGKNERFPETWRVLDETGETIVDIWPFKLEDDFLVINLKGQYVKDRPYNESRVVNFQGTDIKIADPERVLAQKWRHTQKNKKIRDQDAHDFELLGKKLKLE